MIFEFKYNFRVKKYNRSMLAVGKWDLADLGKAKLLKKLAATNYIILDIL